MAAVMRVVGDPDTEVTDAEIIRLSGREPERFAEIFDRYYAEIHGYVARRLGAGLADDVAAETFLIAFDRRDRYDVVHSFARPWLYGIASRDRDVLLLVAWAGLSGEEAARALGIPAGTARSRLHRARRKVRAALGGADPTTVGEDAPWTI